MENDQYKSTSMVQGVQMQGRSQMEDVDDGGLPVGEVIAVIMEYRWLIVIVTSIVLLLGVAFVLLGRPIYRADGLLQVEEKSSSAMSALKDLGSLMGMGGDTTVAAEQEILGSRLVLQRVIDKQRLNIEISPRYFPLVGRFVAKKYQEDDVASPVLGLSRFAWGGESLKVDALEVPFDELDQTLTLVSGDAGSYELRSSDGDVVLKGRVGERATGHGYSIFVPILKARSGEEFRLMRLSLDETLTSITKKYTIKERGKKSGILEVTYQGYDREKIGRVLDDILNTYVRQNVERKSEEAENTLKFLENQLPAVKRQLDAAEAAYNGYRQSRGSLDLNIETQSVLASIVEIDNQIVALKQERDELRQYFTSDHPRIQAVDAKAEKLNARRAKFDADIAKLPDTQQTVLRLARDVEVSTNLYTDLLNTAQQLRVSKAGTVGDVRIIDPATVTTQPVGAKPIVILIASVFIGLILSLVAIWVLRNLKVVIEDPEVIEAKLGLPVYATIPHSQDEVAIVKRAKVGKGAAELLAVTNPEDDAVESLRSLRTTIHFALLDAKQNSLLITGSSPGLGKSFISKNLGVVLAQVGKRIVLVDADLRRGHLHKEFGFRRDIGISEYVAGTASLDDIIKPSSVPNLWIITTGQIPPNPSEILMHLRFEEMLDILSEKFDTLIVDAPPILAVSDAAIIGRHVGATLMVARAGKHPLRELEQAVKRLNQAGVQVKGFVFNDLDTTKQRYRYGYKGYVYRYSYQNKA